MRCGGRRVREFQMRLTYFGHCAFRWETPGGVTVVADPYRNEAGRYWFARLFPLRPGPPERLSPTSCSARRPNGRAIIGANVATLLRGSFPE